MPKILHMDQSNCSICHRSIMVIRVFTTHCQQCGHYVLKAIPVYVTVILLWRFIPVFYHIFLHCENVLNELFQPVLYFRCLYSITTWRTTDHYGQDHSPLHAPGHPPWPSVRQPDRDPPHLPAGAAPSQMSCLLKSKHQMF